ncbi:MAG: BatD family protein [Pseudomonadota bacterium]
MVRISALLIVFIGLVFSTTVQAEVTEVEATVDKNPVIANESFILTVTFNDDVSNAAFEPQQLLSDFIVGRTSVSRQTSIRNGELSKLTRFTTVLIAEQPGDYVIPEIRINGAQSKPINMEVLAAGSDTSDRSEQIAFIETTVDSKQVFLQQPLTYIVRLYLAADLNKGNLVPPEMDNADIRQIGQDEESSEMIDGRRYKVYQRTFQITPNKSGDFSIKGAQFEGEVYAEGQRSIFSSFSNTQPVSTIGEKIQLQVKPIPNNWRGNWLPSELVTISQSLEPDRDKIKVGEPITLTYQLTAVGVKPEQLPDIAPDFSDSLRVYPDNEETDQFVRNGVTIAQKTTSFAIIANNPGELTLPAIEIPWFNTKQQQRDTATTDPVTLMVEGVVNSLDESEPEQPKAEPAQPEKDAEQTPADPPEEPSSPLSELAGQRAIWILVILLALSLIGNLAFIWRRNKRKPLRIEDQKSTQTSLTGSQQWRNFQKACADNHARKADEFLRKWAQQHYGKRLVALTDLARWTALGNQPDTDLHQQLNNLQHSLFSASKPNWTGGKALYQALRNALNESSSKKRPRSLPELYKN